MQEIIDLLKEVGFVDSLQECVNASHKLIPMGEKEENIQLAASKDVLKEFLKEKKNDKILDKFCDFATDLAAEAIIKELDLKPDESYKTDEFMKMIAGLAAIKTILKK